ncbi:MAG TPA: tetratricopeptide repeat protein [Candidatus Sulfotelmatobacter sp.]|nr:tetratricopeptide repeat protein [Candidatus Sulfotelmatobacter sp.]
MEPSPIENGAESAVPRENVFAETEVRKELEKILASELFREAEGLKRFLRFSVEHTLQGEGDQLKEYRLGVDVFDRESSFDPRLDPVVRMAARRLRVKLHEYYEGDGATDPIHIDVPKGGYAAAFSSAPLHPRRIAGEHPKQKHSGLVLPTAVLLLAVVIIAMYWLRQRRPGTAASQESSIVVLPFLNLTVNQDDEYLSDGLADELTGSLSRIPGLRVIARTSAFKFKGKAEDVRSIGSQLSVTSLLEGSLQRSGQQVRITVQLIRTSDGAHLWAETYDRNASDPFGVEDDITEAITRVLRIRVASLGQPGVGRRPVNSEAHDLYLRGRYWWNRRTPPAVWKSVAYFNQALEKEPLYAQAYLGLAEAYTVLGFNDQAAADEVVPKARASAEQALQLDETLSEAHAALAAAVLYHDWALPRAEQEFRRALQLNPNYATAHQWYGLLLLYERRFDEALGEFTQAQRSDPLSLMIVLDIGQVHYYSGHQDAAAQLAQKALTQDPDFAMGHDLLGMAYERQKRFPEAIAEFQKYLDLSGRDPDALMRLALTYADSGERRRAQDLAKEMESAPKNSYTSAYNIAVVHAALGDKDIAFDWLRRALDQHSSSCLLLAVDPVFDGLRSDPRFQQGMRKVGLATQ